MTKLRRKRRYTRETVQLYRAKVYRVVQDFMGMEDAGEPPDYEEVVRQYHSGEHGPDELDVTSVYDNLMAEWERARHAPQPILSEPYLMEVDYATCRRAGIPPDGDSRGQLRKRIATQRLRQRLCGKYLPLPVREHEGMHLVMLDWIHADILDVDPPDPLVTQLASSPHEFLRDATRWLRRGLPGEGQWRLRMGGSKHFFHPEGAGQKVVDKELRRTDKPDWLRRLQEDL